MHILIPGSHGQMLPLRRPPSAHSLPATFNNSIVEREMGVCSPFYLFLWNGKWKCLHAGRTAASRNRSADHRRFRVSRCGSCNLMFKCVWPWERIDAEIRVTVSVAAFDTNRNIDSMFCPSAWSTKCSPCGLYNKIRAASTCVMSPLFAKHKKNIHLIYIYIFLKACE